MGGPSSSVLLRQRLTRARRDQIYAMIRAVSSDVRANQFYACDFWVNDLRPLGGDYVGDGRPCGLAFYESDEPAAMIRQLDPEDAARMTAEIGFVTQQEVSLDAFCNSSEDHAILGRLTLYVAELTGGLVGFGGSILPRLPKDVQTDGWQDVEPYFNAMAREMPGRIVSFPYETARGTTWASHVADAAFLRAWLAHPEFHMIK